MTKTKVIVGKKYRHYKGGLYNVLNIAVHTETEEVLVIYQGVESSKIWARPKAMFEDTVKIDGKTMGRFEELD